MPGPGARKEPRVCTHLFPVTSRIFAFLLVAYQPIVSVLTFVLTPDSLHPLSRTEIAIVALFAPARKLQGPVLEGPILACQYFTRPTTTV